MTMDPVFVKNVKEKLDFLNLLTASKNDILNIPDTNVCMPFNAENGTNKDEIHAGINEFVDVLRETILLYERVPEEERKKEESTKNEAKIIINIPEGPADRYWFTHQLFVRSLVPEMKGVMKNINDLFSTYPTYRKFYVNPEILYKICQNYCCVGTCLAVNGDVDEPPILPVCYPSFIYDADSVSPKTVKKYVEWYYRLLNSSLSDYTKCALCLIADGFFEDDRLNRFKLAKNSDDLLNPMRYLVDDNNKYSVVTNNFQIVKDSRGTYFIRYGDNCIEQ